MFHRRKELYSFTITVQNIKLSHYYPELFLFKWTRGKHLGKSEKVFEAQNKDIPFQKTFRFSSNIFFNTKTGSPKPKSLKIELYQCFPNKDKLYSDIFIDISTYINMPSCIFSTFQMNSSSKLISFLRNKFN